MHVTLVLSELNDVQEIKCNVIEDVKNNNKMSRIKSTHDMTNNVYYMKNVWSSNSKINKTPN